MRDVGVLSENGHTVAERLGFTVEVTPSEGNVVYRDTEDRESRLSVDLADRPDLHDWVIPAPDAQDAAG